MSRDYDSQALKKSCKKLREIERLKQKLELNEEEKEKVSKELFYKDVVRRNKAPCFDDLPEEIVDTIVTFLPPQTRIAILKRKYNKKCIKELLERMPYTLSSLIELWPCAAISCEIAKIAFPKDSHLHALLAGNLQNVMVFRNDFKTEKKYLHYYKAEFEKLIVSVLHHYTRVYKERTYEKLIWGVMGYYSRVANQETYSFTDHDNIWAIVEERKKKKVEELVLKLYMRLKVVLQLK